MTDAYLSPDVHVAEKAADLAHRHGPESQLVSKK